MKIGLYFGSFNPVHNGHLIIAQHVLNFSGADKVWMMVTPQNPLKNSNSLLNENDRYHLVQLALKDHPNIIANNQEFTLPRPSYTIDTLTYLSQKYPQHEFSVTMGSDSFSNIHRWKNYEQILKNYSIIIYQRPGFEVNENNNRIEILQAPLLDISSTFIRELILQQKNIQFLVPSSVKEYIDENNYYKIK